MRRSSACARVATGRGRTRPALGRRGGLLPAWSASRARSAMRSGGRPCCRVPSRSPGPRSWKSSLGQLEAVGRCDKRLQPLDGFLASAASANTQQKPGYVPRLMRPRSWCSWARPKRSAAFDRHQRGVGHVDAHLDHRRGDQHLRLARGETRPSRRPFRPASCGRAPGPGETLPARRWPALRRPRSRLAACGVVGFFDQRRDDVSPAGLRAASCERTPTTWPRSSSAQIGVHLLPARRAVARASKRRDRRTASCVTCAGSAWRSSPGSAGRAPACLSAARCRTPNLCCSSITTSPSLANGDVGLTRWLACR